MDALEIAIQGVEAHSKNNEKQQLVGSLTGPSSPRLAQVSRRQDLTELSVLAAPAVPAGFDVGRDEPASERYGPQHPPQDVSFQGAGLRWGSSAALRYLTMIALVGIVVIAIAIQQRPSSYAALRKAIGYPLSDQSAHLAGAREPTPQQPAQVSPGPPSAKPSPLVPMAYGIYAVSSGKLHELMMLQGAFPTRGWRFRRRLPGRVKRCFRTVVQGSSFSAGTRRPMRPINRRFASSPGSRKP